jgi:hypothetical protein
MARKVELSEKELVNKIMGKKEFSKLPRKDVLRVFEEFNSDGFSQEEKIKRTREKLMKMYTVFASKKLMKNKDRDISYFLKKHISTKERFEFYPVLYKRIFREFNEGDELTLYDLGAGINGLSYNFFPFPLDYVGVEAVDQLVDLINYYFKTRGLNGWAIHESLFEFEKIKKLLKQGSEKKIVFLFKTLDSLEMYEKDYSKKLLFELVPLVDKIVVSWATKTLRKGSRIFATKKWLYEFIQDYFVILDNFKLGNERYVVFRKKR